MLHSQHGVADTRSETHSAPLDFVVCQPFHATHGQHTHTYKACKDGREARCQRGVEDRADEQEARHPGASVIPSVPVVSAAPIWPACHPPPRSQECATRLTEFTRPYPPLIEDRRATSVFWIESRLRWRPPRSHRRRVHTSGRRERRYKKIGRVSCVFVAPFECSTGYWLLCCRGVSCFFFFFFFFFLTVNLVRFSGC